MHDKIKKLVKDHIREKTGGPSVFEVSVIWAEKDRDNSWKAIAVTDFEDTKLYRVVYSSYRRRTRIETYAMLDLITIFD